VCDAFISVKHVFIKRYSNISPFSCGVSLSRDVNKTASSTCWDLVRGTTHCTSVNIQCIIFVETC